MIIVENVELNKEVVQFIEEIGCVLFSPNGDQVYHFPQLFFKNPDGTFNIVSHTSELSNDVKSHIKELIDKARENEPKEEVI